MRVIVALVLVAHVHSAWAWVPVAAVHAHKGRTAAACPGMRTLRRSATLSLQCSAAADTDFSSVEAWEAEYAEIAKRKGQYSGPAAAGGNFLTKIPGFGQIGQAFERAQWKDSSQEEMMRENEEAKKSEKQVDPPPMDGYRVVNTYAHTKESFTQGIQWCPEEKVMFEGSGGADFSHGTRIAKVDLETGQTLMHRKLPSDKYFGEGIVILGQRLFQGWGATTDGKSLIFSDGSPYLFFYHPETFQQERKLLVRYLGRKSGEMTPLRRLNALQYIDGKVYANIWEADRIAVIDPESGLVQRFIELKGLLDTEDGWVQQWSKSDRCLNGIAYDPVNKRMFVTGKMWTKLYEIEVLPGQVDREEAAKKAPPKDYYNPAAGGAFDPLGMGIK